MGKALGIMEDKQLVEELGFETGAWVRPKELKDLNKAGYKIITTRLDQLERKVQTRDNIIAEQAAAISALQAKIEPLKGEHIVDQTQRDNTQKNDTIEKQ